MAVRATLKEMKTDPRHDIIVATIVVEGQIGGEWVELRGTKLNVKRPLTTTANALAGKTEQQQAAIIGNALRNIVSEREGYDYATLETMRTAQELEPTVAQVALPVSIAIE
jgi:hypothetical protein